jgi:ketosteroid isomerase-like protein
MNGTRVGTTTWIMLLLALALPLSAAGTPSENNPATVSEHNRRLVSDAFERWSAGQDGFFTQVLDPAVVWTIAGSGPSAGRFEGRDAFEQRAVRPFIACLSAPVRPVSHQVWADGDHVIVHWHGQATAVDGLPYRNDYAWIMRMQHGRAVDVVAFLDLVPYDAVLKRLGPDCTRGLPAPADRPRRL